MTDTFDATGRDVSRPAATGSDTDYTLSLDDVAARYAAAGHPRTLRTLQRYCASGHLDAQKQATATGDRYLVTPQSVARHVAQIDELAALDSVATCRGRSRLFSQKEIRHRLNHIRQRQGATGPDRGRHTATSNKIQ